MHLLHDLWASSSRRTAWVGALLVLCAAGQVSASALAGPVLVDRSAPLFALLAAALVAAVVGDLAANLVAAGLTADWSADVRRRLCRRAFAQPLPELDATPVGELLDRIDGDVATVASDLRGPGTRLAQSLVTGVLSIVAAAFVWWPAAVVMLVLSVLIGLGLRGPARAVSEARELEEEAWSDLAAVTEEAVHGQDDVRTSLARPYVMGLYADRASKVLTRGRVVWSRSAGMFVLAAGALRIGLVVVVVTGVWALTGGHVDAARLTSIWLLSMSFGLTADAVGHLLPDLQNALGSWARIRSLDASGQEPTGGRAPSEGDVVVKGLTFRYPAATGGRGAALRDVDLVFARGRSYAVVGRTGSGKSTLAKVLTRSVDVPRGAVFLDGVDLNEIDLEALRRWVATVPQRTDVLAGTLAENIALFDEDLLDAAREAIEELGLTSWVADLPDGMDTRLGDGGHTLSAGQEQLVAFARILVRDPHVVILDEATARMDPVTEARVQQATERLLDGRIGVVIAHRLSSLSSCDEVVVMEDGVVVEAGPLRESQRFATLLAAGQETSPVTPVTPSPRLEVPRPRGPVTPVDDDAPPPPVVRAPRARTAREVLRLAQNDPRFGLAAVGVWLVNIVISLEGSLLPWLWGGVVDGNGSPVGPAVAITVALLIALPLPWFSMRWFPEWYVRQMLRIGANLVHGQTDARRRSRHTPAEVVAQAGDTERVVELADNVLDLGIASSVLVAMTLITGSFVPGAFFSGSILMAGFAAALFGRRLAASAQRTVAARAAFATGLTSSLSAARTVKTAGATGSVLAHLGVLERERALRQRQEVTAQVWSRTTPAFAAGLLPIAVWALYLNGTLTGAATLVAVSVLGSTRWFAFVTSSLISQLPSARVWTRRTVAMTGVESYSATVPGVDLSAGTAPAPELPPRTRLRRLDLTGFGVVHDDGVVAAHDVDLSVERGQLVLVLGPVGAGKSSLLRALAGILPHTGDLLWNGERVDEPEHFLRPNQVGYVGQLPRVLSGTVRENISLGHEVDAAGAVRTAQLTRDLAAAGGSLDLLIGHKGTRLSGGQLQRLALARALAPRTELLVADDVSSALDVATELDLWRALREHGVTVVGSTSKRAALNQADHVVVLLEGRAVAQGTWSELHDQWGHLAG